MTKRLLFFIFIGFLSSSFAFTIDDQGDPVNQKDKDGLKQGNWVFFGKDRPQAGFPEEGKIEEGPYKDDRKEGTWIKYHNDGITPKLKGEYHNNRPNGAYTKINADGSVREQGTFNRNKYSGGLVRFHPNGQKEYDATFNDSGNEEGPVKFYYANGQVEFEYTANDGIPTGDATRFYENGDIKEKITYGSNGSVEKREEKEMVNASVVVVDLNASKEKAPVITQPRTKGAPFAPNAYNKVYNENDEIWQDGDFRSGRLWEGKVYEYDSDGILLKVKVFRLGVFHSEGQL